MGRAVGRQGSTHQILRPAANCTLVPPARAALAGTVMLPAVMPTYLHALAVNGSVAVKAGGALREVAIAQPTGVWKFAFNVIKVAL